MLSRFRILEAIRCQRLRDALNLVPRPIEVRIVSFHVLELLDECLLLIIEIAQVVEIFLCHRGRYRRRSHSLLLPLVLYLFLLQPLLQQLGILLVSSLQLLHDVWLWLVHLLLVVLLLLLLHLLLEYLLLWITISLISSSTKVAVHNAWAKILFNIQNILDNVL